MMKKPVKIAKATEARAPKAPPVSAVDNEQQNETTNAMLRAAMAQKMNVAFSQVLSLMLRNQAYRTHFIAELEWMLVPPISTGQFLVTERKASANDIPTPVAAVMWAKVNDAVNKRLLAGGGRPKLAPAEWASGNIPWLVDAIGEPQETAKLVKHLAEKIFAKEGLRANERQPDGSYKTRIFGRQSS